jgi:RNA polymerase sigma factor (sigma-70 family)
VTAHVDLPDPARTAAGPALEAAVAASLELPARFALVYDAQYPAVHRYVAARLGPDTAEDVAAEVFLTAFRTRARFDPGRGAVRPWLFGIATNLVARHGRGERRRQAGLRAAAGVEHGPGHESGSEAGFEEGVAEKVAAQRLRPQLGAALAALKAPDRDVLLLVAVAGLSYAEVSQALGIPAGTVGSRMNRARATVRKVLGPALATPHTTHNALENPHG